MGRGYDTSVHIWMALRTEISICLYTRQGKMFERKNLLLHVYSCTYEYVRALSQRYVLIHEYVHEKT